MAREFVPRSPQPRAGWPPGHTRGGNRRQGNTGTWACPRPARGVRATRDDASHTVTRQSGSRGIVPTSWRYPHLLEVSPRRWGTCAKRSLCPGAHPWGQKPARTRTKVCYNASPSSKTIQIRDEAISLAYTLSVEIKVAGDRLVGYKVREIAAECKFSQELKFEVLEQVISVARIKAVLVREGRVAQRERKLNMVMTVLMLIAMHIYSNVSMGAAMRKASRGCAMSGRIRRMRWPAPAP